MITEETLPLSKLAKQLCNSLLKKLNSDIICSTTGEYIRFSSEIELDHGTKGPGYLAFGFYYVYIYCGLRAKSSVTRWVEVWSAETGRLVGTTEYGQSIALNQAADKVT